MEWDRGRSGGRELIDFASSPPSRGLEFNARLSVGAVTLTHCTSRPIEGRHLGAAQHYHIIGNCMRWTFHFAISCRGDDFVPCLHRRGPKGSMRSCRCEMTLDVEGVVDCRMH